MSTQERAARSAGPAMAREKTDSAKQQRQPASASGEKITIRRLPPGMTQEEFEAALGDEWKVGGGRVDWFSYKPGKIAKDASKISVPSVGYVHLVRQDDVRSFMDVVKNGTWEDAKGTFSSSCLLGPPAAELSIYKKIPSTRRRQDARQGTIDQDPDFMKFLDNIVNPPKVPEEPAGEQDEAESQAAETKVTSTPLIDYLRQKKANRGKDSAAKVSKQGQSSKSKSSGQTADDGSSSSSKRGSKEPAKADKAADNKAPKQTVKIMTKKASSGSVAAAVELAAEKATEVATKLTTEAAAAAAARESSKNRRAAISAAARIIQRDMGLSVGSAHRKARLEIQKASSDSKDTAEKSTEEASTKAATSNPTETAAPAAATGTQDGRTGRTRGSRGGRGRDSDKGKTPADTSAEPQSSAPAAPIVLLRKKDSSAAASDAGQKQSGATGSHSEAKTTPQASHPSGPKTTTTPSAGSKGTPGAKGKATAAAASQPTAQQKGGKDAAGGPSGTKAFVKHANPSQGITAEALRQAMAAFGTVRSVEIERRKGLAYVDFADNESLVRAVAASPVSIAQGAVQVVEFREKPKPSAAAAASNATKQQQQQPAGGAGAGAGERQKGGQQSQQQSQQQTAAAVDGAEAPTAAPAEGNSTPSRPRQRGRGRFRASASGGLQSDSIVKGGGSRGGGE